MKAIAAWVVALLVVIGAGVAVEAGGSAAVRAIGPVCPEALATGPNGALYVSDQGRDEILERLPSGRFEVVAGTGKAGFTGDGGPAIDAEIDQPGGMAVTAGGTIYFADEANNRIRMITPRGVISTVAGDGGVPGGVNDGTPALRADLGGPTDVAIGPDGELYIAVEGTNQVLRLTAGGRLDVAAGPPRDASAGVAGVGGPAPLASPDGPSGLAFDAAGDLYVAGDDTKDLLVIDRDGIMRHPARSFYPRGDGGLVRGPGGSVYAMDDLSIVRLGPTRVTTVVDFVGHTPALLGGVFEPDGIAAGPGGVVYTDTCEGNGFATTSAIVEVLPGHQVEVLWRARRS